MDDVDPTISDTYADDGVWVNEDRTVTFNITDNDSGIPSIPPDTIN